MPPSIALNQIKRKHVNYIYITILMNDRQYMIELSGVDHIPNRKMSVELGDSRLLKPRG